MQNAKCNPDNYRMQRSKLLISELIGKNKVYITLSANILFEEFKPQSGKSTMPFELLF